MLLLTIFLRHDQSQTLEALRLPAERLREVNRMIEEKACGAFRTEFYPTYDFMPVWENLRKQT